MIPTFIVSKDRPLYIASYLESLRGQPLKKTVFFKVSSIEMKVHYQMVAKEFPEVEWIDENQFGGLAKTLGGWLEKNNDLCMVSVDDNICLRPISEDAVRTAMEDKECFGFSLRLSEKAHGHNPMITRVKEGVYSYFPKQYEKKTNWAYVFEVSSTVYRPETILAALALTKGNTVNKLEIAGYNKYMGTVEKMACFMKAPLVNIYVDSHRHKNFEVFLSEADALKLYLEGKRFDPEKYRQYRDDTGNNHIGEIFLK